MTVDSGEDVKPQTLPVIETHFPIHHSGEEHVPVLVVKTEDGPFIAHTPVIAQEERLPVSEQQAVMGEDLPTEHEEQESVEQSCDQEAMEESYHQYALEEQGREQEVEAQDENTESQQRGLFQEQTEGSGMYDPHDVVEQGSQQLRGEISESILAVRERFHPEEENIVPEQDSSVPWNEEPEAAETQQSDEFFISKEQNIPQSHSFADVHQEKMYNGDVIVSTGTGAPWVMVDHPPALERENYVPRQDEMVIHKAEPRGMSNENFVPEVQEAADETVYHNEVESADIEEAGEAPIVEVSTQSVIIMIIGVQVIVCCIL